jgi:transposase InsO family protein
MSTDQEQKKAQEIMDFRYAIIAELLNPYLSPAQRRELMREKAGRQYEIPYSNRSQISYECIRKWYTSFGRFGKEGLRPKVRSDKGVCRALSPEEQAAFLQHLEQNPELTAKAACKTLQQQGVLRTEISKSSLSRLVLAAGLDRQNRMRSKEQILQLKFAFTYPLECVQADLMHAFELPDERGKQRRTMLLAVLDDATRRVVYGNFSFRESSLEFEYALRHVLLTHGRIGRVFTDNGSTFVSSETLRILSILGIPLIHSRVGYPAARGKVERFFRTVRDQFLRPLDKPSVRSLADLNARFHTWLQSEYHRSPHRGLGGRTPLEAWLEKAYHIIHLDPTVNLDEIFTHEVRRRVYGDCTFTLDGILYEVPVVLKGKIITVRFNPLQPVRRLHLFYEKHCYGEARVVDTYANTRVKRTRNNDPDSGLSQRDQAGRHPKHPTASPTRAAFSASKLNLKGEHTS